MPRAVDGTRRKDHRKKILKLAKGYYGRRSTNHKTAKDAVAKATRSYLEAHDKIPRGLAVSAEEIREGLVALVSVFLADPQFQGQTKDRLNNPDVKPAIDGVLRAALETWFHTRPPSARPSRPGWSRPPGRGPRPATP
ncbi:MAG TPA: 50S ribosomal protein L20 [Spirochaetales bacterium]|nr:50S ribosomal protein L20 [Spirochaetales bacterium]